MSLSHWIFVAVIVLLLFGSRRLPLLGRQLGETIREFKKSLNGKPDIDVTDSVRYVEDRDDRDDRA